MTSPRDAKIFGHLRSLAHGEPSRSSWAQLCTNLCALSPAAHPSAVHYVQSLTRAWPVTLCTLPSHANVRARFIASPSLFALVRHLSINAKLGLDEQTFARYHWPHLTSLTLLLKEYPARMGQLAIPALDAQPELEQLSITFECPPKRASELLALLFAMKLSSLRRLQLIYKGHRFYEIEASWQAPWLALLRELDIAQASPLERGALLAIEQRRLPALQLAKLSSGRLLSFGLPHDE